MLVPYSNVHALSGPPLGLTLAFNVAEVSPTPLAAFVSTDGAATFSVLNVTSGPSTGPPELFCHDPEVVFGVRAVSFADTATGLSPDPGSEPHGALDP